MSALMSARVFLVSATLALLPGQGTAAEIARPSLILTAEGVEEIKAAETPQPLFAAALQEARQRVATSIAEGVLVPTPKDPGGGYTHERHKENYKVIHDAGLLYQITGDQRYFDHARAMLLALSLIHI